jgi:hypothetical protein
METYIKNALVGLVAAYLSLSGLAAYALPDPNAELIALKKVCSVSETNCFTSPGPMLDWVWATRKPSAANPLIVDIAPGTWVLPANKPFCPSATPANGNVTFRGSGRSNTILTGGGFSLGTFTGVKAVLSVDNCSNLVFQDLGIQSDYRRQVTGSVDGIHWRGGAGSSWSNVEVQANHYGWFDSECIANPSVTHYWFGSKVESRTGPTGSALSWGFYSFCGRTNFYGGQIIGLHDTAQLNTGVAAVAINGIGQGRAVFSIYGGSVHATTTQSAGIVGVWGVTGLIAYNTGEVHMHGGSITAEANNAAQNQDVYGVLTFQNALGHAIDTAFVVKPSGTGRAYRISTEHPAFGGDGMVEAPFLWPAGTNPPTPGDASGNKHLISTNGNDLFVETDCAAAGCQSAGVEPHLQVYSDQCTTAGPWFDVVTRKCRGQ